MAEIDHFRKLLFDGSSLTFIFRLRPFATDPNLTARWQQLQASSSFKIRLLACNRCCVFTRTLSRLLGFRLVELRAVDCRSMASRAASVISGNSPTRQGASLGNPAAAPPTPRKRADRTRPSSSRARATDVKRAEFHIGRFSSPLNEGISIKTDVTLDWRGFSARLFGASTASQLFASLFPQSFTWSLCSVRDGCALPAT